ncbi:MAG: hypothetical protein M9938_01130 [Solirubrobacterales bacterium]|nr:hypothetical protein [Solirubrobacterales bacterium]
MIVASGGHRPPATRRVAALAALTGGLDVAGVLADGDFMGRLPETFVLVQLRPAVSPAIDSISCSG